MKYLQAIILTPLILIYVVCCLFNDALEALGLK